MTTSLQDFAEYVETKRAEVDSHIKMVGRIITADCNNFDAFVFVCLQELYDRDGVVLAETPFELLNELNKYKLIPNNLLPADLETNRDSIEDALSTALNSLVRESKITLSTDVYFGYEIV